MAFQNAKVPSSRRWSLTATIPYVDLAFDANNTEASALNLVYWVRPKWREHVKELKITKFTEGITNTVRLSFLSVGTCSTNKNEIASYDLKTKT